MELMTETFHVPNSRAWLAHHYVCDMRACLVLCLLVISCASTDSGLNVPFTHALDWHRPRVGDAYAFNYQQLSFVDGILDSAKSIWTKERLFYSGVDTLPGYFAEGQVDSVVPTRYASRFVLDNSHSTYYLHLALDSLGNFWLSTEFFSRHRIGVDPKSHQPNPTQSWGQFDTGLKNRKEIFAETRFCTALKSYHFGFKEYEAVHTTDSSFHLLIQVINPTETDTSFSYLSESHWFVPALGCYARRETRTFSRDAAGHTTLEFDSEELTDTNP
jgi:hypothetical protein